MFGVSTLLDSGRLRHRVNVRLLLFSLVAVGLLAAGIFFWHQRATTQLSSGIRSRAEKFADNGEFAKAAQEVWRFLKIYPEDADAQRRLADYYFEAYQQAPSPSHLLRCIDIHHRAIGLADDNDQNDLVHRLAEMLLSAGRFSEARTAAQKLFSDQQYQKSAKRTAAIAAFNQASREVGRQIDEHVPAGEILLEAINVNPGDAVLCTGLASLYRQFPDQLSEPQRKRFPSADEQADRADQIMDDLISANPGLDSSLARYQYRTEFNIDGAEKDLLSALEYEPENAAINLEYGNSHLRDFEALDSQHSDEETQQLLAQAEKSVREAIRLDPKFVMAFVSLGDVLSRQDRPDESIEIWEQGLALSNSEGSSTPHSIYLKLAEAKIAKRDFVRAVELLDQLKSLVNSDQQARRITPRRRVALNQSMLFLRGIAASNQGKFLEARPFLKQAIELDLESSELAVTAWRVLGEGYSNAGVYDVAAECFGRASLERPNNSEFWSLAGDSWIRAGQHSQAIEYYNKLCTFEPNAENWLSLAHALNASELSKPVDQMNLTPFNAALQNAVALRDSASPATAWKIKLVETVAQFIELGESEQEETQSILDGLAKQMPDDPIAIRQLMFAYEQIGDRIGSDAVREKHLTAKPATAPRFLTEAQLLVSRGKIDEAIKHLEAALDVVPDDQKIAIKFALVDVELAGNGDVKQAIERLVGYWSDDRNQLDILIRIANLTVSSGFVESDAQAWEADLRLIEGAEGHWSLFIESSRDLKRALQTDAGRERLRLLESAALKQQELRKFRPLWPTTYTLAGDIASQYPKQQGQAIEYFKRAIELGERKPLQVLKLVYLLNRNKRFIEAGKYLPLIGELENSKIGFALSHDILLNLNRLDQAESLARKRVEQRVLTDVTPLLRLGQILTVQNQLEEAEKWFLQVISEDQGEQEVALTALFNLYVKQGEKSKAVKKMEELLAFSKDKFSESQRCFIKAQAYELLNDANAGEYYEKALNLEPDNPRYWKQAAVYFARQGEMDKAIDLAGKVREIPGNDTADARALLVTLLAERGSDADWTKIDRLKRSFVGNKFAKSSLDRLYAVLYTIKSATTNTEKKENLDGALRLLTEIGEDVAFGTAANHLALARINVQLREIETDPKQRELLAKEALKHHKRAGDAAGATAGQLRIVASFLLDESLFAKTETLLSRISQMDEKNIGRESIATFSLRVRLLRKTQKEEKARLEIDAYVKDQQKVLSKNRWPELYQTIGEICLRAEMFERAEKWFKQGDDGSLEIFRKIVLSMLRQKKITEALDICKQRYLTSVEKQTDVANNSRVIQLVSGLLSIPGANPEHFEMVDDLIALAKDQLADNGIAINAIATIRLVQGRREEAIELFRNAVASEPNNAIILNNIATALASDPTMVDEAMRYIERAIKAHGRETPALLDTKASILIDREPKESEKIWRELTNDRADPRITFQLADALYRQEKFEESRKLLEQALERGLMKQILTPAQKKRLEILQSSNVSAESKSAN